VTIDGITLEVPSNYTEVINEIGSCRLCVVEVDGVRNLPASCIYPVQNGMNIRTNTPRVREARRVNLELILSNHDRSCLTCIRNTKCELQDLAERFGITDIEFQGENVNYPLDDASPAIVRNPNKCCQEVQNVFAIGAVNRGFDTLVSAPFYVSLNDSPCISCGQCITACPTGALYEKDHIQRVYRALADKRKHVVVQTAPAVRVALGEEFGMPVGSIVTGKMVAALRRLGFEVVFDTDFGADLTIMEEGSELIERLKYGGKLPMITSCSPGWINFCEKYYPDFMENLSTCKSPHMMLGALIKTYYAEKMGWNPEDVYVVSVMPCTAKKVEIERPENMHDGLQDVDAVLTTRELARMIKEAGIDFVNLPDEEFDQPLGMSTGAAVIFGATGGVMEAALRTVSEIVEGKPLDKIDFEEVRGLEGVREATVTVDGLDLKLAIVNGTGNAKKLLDKIRSGEAEYHFIEIMGCPGGCITGGGQPIHHPNEMAEVRKLRAAAIYQADKNLPLRKSHENPAIKQIYEEYLGHPLGEKSHHLLHTHYSSKPLYKVTR